MPSAPHEPEIVLLMSPMAMQLAGLGQPAAGSMQRALSIKHY
jgi:hypothetical protein